MTLTRFHVRTLMIAVAIVCLPLGWIGEVLYRRRERFDGIADNYAREMRDIERNAAARHPEWIGSEGYRRTKAWHEHRQRKWERAALYPWPPVQADPPTLP